MKSEFKYDFANILFSGPCNRFCPWCIGKELPEEVNENNLDLFPPKNIETFIETVKRYRIRHVVFTGTITDPQLYRHQARLLELLRTELGTLADYSLHTNGVLALSRMDLFNSYDKACISFPSFNPESYEKLMGSRRVPDLARIVERSTIPVKVSCVINEHNVAEIENFLSTCAGIGIQRVVLRRLFGETRSWDILANHQPSYFFRRNPVYHLRGMEVTYWNFDTSESTSINLFPDGTIGSSYLLTQNFLQKSERFGPSDVLGLGVAR